jgi:hypothetical protein
VITNPTNGRDGVRHEVCVLLGSNIALLENLAEILSRIAELTGMCRVSLQHRHYDCEGKGHAQDESFRANCFHYCSFEYHGEKREASGVE